MSPTSYQTAPSRVCVSAFYRGTRVCQPVNQTKALVVQSVSSPKRGREVLWASQAKAFSSIGSPNSIEKINSSRKLPTTWKEESNYWCYIQVLMRYWPPVGSHPV